MRARRPARWQRGVVRCGAPPPGRTGRTDCVQRPRATGKAAVACPMATRSG